MTNTAKAWGALFVVLAVAAMVVVALVAAGVLNLTSERDDGTAPAAVRQLDSPTTSPTASATPSRLSEVNFVDVRTGRTRPLPRAIRSTYAVHIQVSPDGSKLAFNDGTSINVTRADGTHMRELADAALDSSASWSPDGKSLVYAVAGRLLLVDVSTGERTRLLNAHQPIYHPNFNNEGNLILFTRKLASDLALWTVSVNGGRATVLFRHPKGAAFGTFSPDGDSIAFRHTQFDGSPVTEMTNNYLLVVDSDGENLHQLGHWSESMSQIDSGALWPMWSPDGTRIAYETLYGRGVFVRNLRTGELTRIADGTRPSWFDNNTLIVEDP